MADSDIDALKRAIGVQTDAELAMRLGIGHTAVSQWRSRGKIPKKYTAILGAELDKNYISDALRLHIYRVYENHYFIMAALAFLPEVGRLKLGDDALATGKKLEQALLDLAAIAAQATETDLKKRVIVNDDDCRTLINIMHRNYSDRIGEILEGLR